MQRRTKLKLTSKRTKKETVGMKIQQTRHLRRQSGNKGAKQTTGEGCERRM